MTRSGEEVFAATLLKINPRGRGQSTLVDEQLAGQDGTYRDT